MVDTDTVEELLSVVVTFEDISGARGEGWAVTLDVTDTVTGNLLKEDEGKLLDKSNLGVKGVVLAGAVVPKLLIEDVVLGVSVNSGPSLVEGALVSVFGRAVVAEVTPKVVFIVMGGEDMTGEEKVFVDGFVASTEPLLAISVVDLTVGVVRVVVLAKVVMMLLGFMGEEGCVAWVGVVGLNEDIGLEKEVYVGDASGTTGVTARLALPHSASTSAMISPPEIESKVRREEMSARSVLRLVSPGTMGGCDSSPPGDAVLDGVVAELSWAVWLLAVGSELSVPGLLSDRG